MSKTGRICEPRIVKCTCGNEVFLNKLKKHIINIHGKSLDEFDSEYFNIMFKTLNIKTLVNEYNSGESKYSLTKKYNLKNNDIVFILKHLGIKKRNISESHKTSHYTDKITQTLIEKYGVDNVSKNSEIKLKKINTMKKNFGRINNFSNPEILMKAKSNVNYEKCWETLQFSLLEKYGVNRITHIDFVRKKISNTNKTKYENLSEDDKLKMNHRLNEMRKLIKHRYTSKIQTRINDVLNQFNYEYLSNKVIGEYNFDMIFTNKTILEVNGDYWHASPIKYKPTDIIKYPGGLSLTANEVWLRDKKKRNSVEKNGYKVVYLWEHEINKMTDIDIINFITKNIGL